MHGAYIIEIFEGVDSSQTGEWFISRPSHGIPDGDSVEALDLNVLDVTFPSLV